MSIKENQLDELTKFLKKNPNPSVKVIGTLVKGGISCIGAVPRLFGAEVHCHSDVYDAVCLTVRMNSVNNQ